MHGHRGIGKTDFHRDAVIADQKLDLLDQVVAEQVGPRDRGRIGAGGRDMAEGQSGIDLVEAGDGDANLRVEGTDAAARIAFGHSAQELVGQETGGLGIKHLKPVHGSGGAGKALCGRGVGGKDGVGVFQHRGS